MLSIIAGIIVIIIIGFMAEFLSVKWDGLRKYQYRRKDFFMTKAEHECYDAISSAVGNQYYIFPQVHLPSIVESKVKGQNWNGAFKHINQKSVDFVLCDKAHFSPKLVIELDDHTHERPDRKERDKEVERILQNAGLPLLRLENHGRFNPRELIGMIDVSLRNRET